MSTDREIVMYIKKKENGFWPRLLSSSTKQPWLKVDFNRWVDENESEPELGGMDNFANMFSDMSRFNDYGADDADADVDSDDEGKISSSGFSLRSRYSGVSCQLTPFCYVLVLVS